MSVVELVEKKNQLISGWNIYRYSINVCLYNEGSIFAPFPSVFNRYPSLGAKKHLISHSFPAHW